MRVCVCVCARALLASMLQGHETSNQPTNCNVCTGVVFQIRHVTLTDGSEMMVLWLSRDPEDVCERSHSHGNLTLASSFSSALDQSQHSLGEVGAACVSISLSVSVCRCLCLSVCLSVSFSLQHSLGEVGAASLSLSPSLSVYLCMCVCVSLCLSLSLSVCLSVSLSLSQPVAAQPRRGRGSMATRVISRCHLWREGEGVV